MARTSDADDPATRDDLERQIEALKADIAGIAQTLSQMGADRRDAAVDGVQQTAADLRSRGAEAAAEARNKGSALGEHAADAVREQPATAVALAVGAGFLVGLMTGRR